MLVGSLPFPQYNSFREYAATTKFGELKFPHRPTLSEGNHLTSNDSMKAMEEDDLSKKEIQGRRQEQSKETKSPERKRDTAIKPTEIEKKNQKSNAANQIKNLGGQ